jgi:exosortase/archaeosortase family protein
MLAMAAITALYAHLTQRTFVRQATLFACAVPLAIVGNVFRIMTVALVARLFGHDLALKLYHDYSAFIIFPVAILLMLAAGRWIDRWGRRRSEPA